ncbi:MAG: hypothetical protein IPN32_04595 [Deltaproteobacteria bacterium]|nr:hypothetical protein [Deltaproteobacteria bacterium]
MTMHRTLLASLLVATACSNKPEATSDTGPPPSMVATPAPADPARKTDAPESVVFADRTSLAYVLLVTDDVKVPTREQLTALVDAKLGGDTQDAEVGVLRELISLDPQGDPRLRPGNHPRDLLGLYIEGLDASARRAAVSEGALADPVLTRELEDDERAALATHRRGILLRADYRNERAVRGLRLLQTLVRLLASETGALIHDPDTGETMGVEAFTRRRLQAGLGNVADQVAVVPFPDPRHGAPFIRLTTRGMRRFGSADLELDGLPLDEQELQRATYLLHGLAYRMTRLAELDPSGYPLEMTDDVEVTHADVTRAYSRLQGKIPRCEDCIGEVTVGLRKRPAEPSDPQDHLVLRVVAPRDDAAGLSDHPAWVRQAIAKLLGKP